MEICDKKQLKVNFSTAEQSLILDAEAALYWPEPQLLVVSDLHLEKGSYLAERGHPLPLYDSIDTLIRLQKLVDYYQPKILLSLGDNLHDLAAFRRMSGQSFNQLTNIAKQVSQWIWILGNHDASPVEFLKQLPNLYFENYFTIGDITFVHDSMTYPFQVIGHYHPKITVKGLTGKCFLISANTIIMPAFGSYTGGLSCQSRDFLNLMPQQSFKTYMIYNQKLWRVK